MKSKSCIMWGIVLISAGVLLVLNQLGILHISGNMLPAIVMLGGGVCFHIGFGLSGGKKPGLLVPGGILLVYGGMYLTCAIGTFWWMAKLWPLFILGIALGLFELYVFSRGRSGSMIPVFILTTIGGAFLLGNLTTLSGFVVVGLALVILGVVLLIGAFRRKAEPAEQTAAEPCAETAPAGDEPVLVSVQPETEAQAFADAPEVVAQPQTEDTQDCE